MNAGAFHVMISNLIGIHNKGLVIDRERSIQVLKYSSVKVTHSRTTLFEYHFVYMYYPRMFITFKPHRCIVTMNIMC